MPRAPGQSRDPAALARFGRLRTAARRAFPMAVWRNFACPHSAGVLRLASHPPLPCLQPSDLAYYNAAGDGSGQQNVRFQRLY